VVGSVVGCPLVSAFPATSLGANSSGGPSQAGFLRRGLFQSVGGTFRKHLLNQ
jgi:hypothetical protein